MRAIAVVICVIGSAVTGACATSDPGWTGSGQPFGQAESHCRQEAERVPESARQRAFEECMARAGWRRG